MSKALGLAPTIDEDELRGIESLAGQEIRIEPYNEEATRDTIRHYAFGIGDDNPLWCDPSYGASSIYGDIVAPPTFLYSSFDGAIGAGLPGVQPIYAGTEWTFHSVLRRNEAVVPTARFGPVRRLSGRTAGDMLIQTAEVGYHAGDRLLATASASTFRVPRRGAERGLSYAPREEHVYTEEDLQAIRHDALHEYRRGAEPLVFSDVAIGDPIPGVVKGPIDRITMTAYYAGCIGSPGYKACELAWKYREWADHAPERLPTNYDPSYFAETVLPSLGHQDGDVAQEIGMPNAYDNGPQRCGWFAHAVTNWMGDRSFLHRLRIRLRRPDIFGDTVWIKGAVTDLRTEGAYGVVEMDLHARNQLGEDVAEGWAAVLCSLDPDGPPPVPAG